MSTIIEPTTHLMTADELSVMPHHENGRDYRLALVRGELKRMSPTKPLHGVFTAEITLELGLFIRTHKLGRVFGAETGFLVERDPDTVYGIDVAFVSHERLKEAGSLEKFFAFAPDLAVEVLSPSNTVDEIDEKVMLYFAAGSRAVWVFNPRRRNVKAYRSPNDVRILTAADTLDGEDVLPGFRLVLADLFALADS